MNKNVRASTVNGTVKIPSSKSYFQRTLAAASLAQEKTIINFYNTNKDVEYLIEALRQLGHQIEVSENEITIDPKKAQLKNIVEVNFGESGLASRMMIPVLAAIGGDYTVTGQGSILNRPFDPIVDLLSRHGVGVKSQKGLLPIEIKGHLNPGNFEIDAELSSQFVTGLLMALPILKGESTLEAHNPKSWPYIKMTLQVLNDFGVQPEEMKQNSWKLFNCNYKSKGEYFIEGDWSGAAFWIVGALISGTIVIEGLNPNSLQADRAILEVLDQIDANYLWQDNTLKVETSELKPFAFDATDCPDLFPALAVLAACTNGDSGIKGVNRLKHKESDRALVLQSEFAKLGVAITIDKDVMIIHGKGEVLAGQVSSHNDHRIAMAMAVAGLKCKDAIVIEDAEAVAKSYTNFWEQWNTIAQ